MSESNSERIMKIGLHLAQKWLHSIAHSVYYINSMMSHSLLRFYVKLFYTALLFLCSNCYHMLVIVIFLLWVSGQRHLSSWMKK